MLAMNVRVIRESTITSNSIDCVYDVGFRFALPDLQNKTGQNTSLNKLHVTDSIFAIIVKSIINETFTHLQKSPRVGARSPRPL